MSGSGRVRWGILSTANIGLTKVIPAIGKSAHSEVVAIASRELDKSRSAARALGIGRAYGSYEDLLADPDIDAIYNPLPNHLHVELTLAANAAGKHVLCEKPIAVSAEEALRLRGARADRLIMEGFMVRFHPQWLRMREIVRSGELGTVRGLNVTFNYHNVKPDNIRNRRDMGGGGLLDIGGYAVTSGRFFFEAEPLRVVALVDRDPTFGTDRQASVIADFGDGRQMVFVVSTQLSRNQSIHIFGTKARAEICVPFTPRPGEATAITIDSGHSVDGHLSRREIIAPSDQYSDMVEAFALAVLGRQALPYGVEDAIRSMRVLDAILESERRGGWVRVRS
ncbi:MAG: NAD-binding protein [Pelagibacterium sp. SCN 64-44]|nr:MAG: NAD-binding protein [Pelagibacterium sp. SCN 64-44]